jgi:predicted acyl esterase
MRTLCDRELRWNNHYRKGEDNGIDREPPVELFVMGVNRWFSFTDWPVPGARGWAAAFGGARGGGSGWLS